MSKQPKGVRYGGRAKGTPNKTTTATKEVIANLLTKYSNNGQMSDDFNALDPKDRLMVAERLMQYVMPKMQATAIGIEGGEKKITIESRLIELSKENN